MTDVKEISCKLCLTTITDKGFEVIDNIVRDILDGLLLKLKFDSESKGVICNVCRRKLNKASEFKSTCMNTDNTIAPYVDSEKMLQLDIREVYIKEKKSELTGMSSNQKICRLCMQPVKREFSCIREEELEAIHKLTPEININIIKDPVVCKPCFDSLCTHNSFLKDCLEVEQNIKGFENSATENRIETSASAVFIKTENMYRELDINEMEMSIKAEYDIKDEERSFTEHLSEHKDPSQIQTYKCNECNFETKYKGNMKKHQLKHEDSSKLHMYRCNDCDYETKYKYNIKTHQLKHKVSSQV
ncbi:uncharacterized protein LOC111691737 [Anoplophora glabripennis]|uniref:uncharacterized protein LOC111691737 n=1 Tax=Anoplophora glabripennis TaxID=217634 RepID=UPI000C786B07|nr:uncharacterized protein LOC111691737 [Anoplophora glabripennis]